MTFAAVFNRHLDTLPRGGRADVARRLGVTGATITRWAQGSVPEDSWVPQLARLLGETEDRVRGYIVAGVRAQEEADWLRRLPTMGTEALVEAAEAIRRQLEEGESPGSDPGAPPGGRGGGRRRR